MTNVNKAWLQAAKKGDVTAMKALADHLEEQGNSLEAASWRSKAGLSRVIYQVINTKTNEVVKEYRSLIHCEHWIASYREYKQRKALKVRVLEFTERVITEMTPRPKPNPMWKGPVKVIAGEFAGKKGQSVGNEWNRRNYLVVIDGVQHELQASHVEFLP